MEEEEAHRRDESDSEVTAIRTAPQWQDEDEAKGA